LKEESSFSEEKEAKRLLSVGGSRPSWAPAAAKRDQKSFLLLFSSEKRRLFLP
jgi:hypothetical protein